MVSYAALFVAAAAAVSSSSVSAAAAAADTPEMFPRLSGDKLAELMQLSLPEIKRRMQIIFTLVDADSNGVITAAEAEAWSLQLKEAMHKHQVQQEFASIDKNKDNRVTLEELEGTYTEGADAASQDAHKEEVKKRFAAVDKDNSGDLTLEEVTILMDPGKDETLMAIEVEEILAAQDKDKDGAISLEEFLQNEGSALSEPEKEELKREFAAYDSNGDSRIDEAELRTVIQHPHAHDLKEMLEALKAEMQQGEISKEAWEQKYEALAVSLLTDNGELLRFPEEYEGLNIPFKGISEGPAEEDPLNHDEL